ncbi:MAG: protoglobin domain-containing protein [Meiothermus sp.]|uniref:protoglobin domain-containing protein n=1 Tax=Meiothermus sp. TaxID=1955249 RepID=UPI00298EF52F|nr:protoglobin domain-containing protein [Meiothermus sp.]MDW8091786.1 protoglobin domain-containing protein [Meiothermus sp.]
MSKTFFHELAKRALATLPPEDRFTPEDAALLQSEKDYLLGLGEGLVQAFYDSLFAHPPTREVFQEGERPAREETLRSWWRRTVEGPFDEAYWAWQAYVGLLHVRRKVTNTMMWGHAGLVARYVGAQALSAGKPALAEAAQRLMATVGAVIGEAYQEVYLEVLAEATGQSRALIEANVKVAIEEVTGGRPL